MNKNLILSAIILFFMVFSLSCERTPKDMAQWHDPLYLGNNEYWRQRIPIIINNNTNRDIAGDPISIKIGNDIGQAPLVGELVESIRIVTDQSAELIFQISDGDGNIIERGPVPENSIIVFPVECKADTVALHYIYFNNPSSWANGDIFRTEIKTNDSITATVLSTEKLFLREIGKTDKWFGEKDKEQGWQSRAAIKTMNFGNEKIVEKLICVNVESVLNRLHAELDENTAIQVTDGTRAIPYYKIGHFVFFNQDIPAKTARTNYIYFNSGDKVGNDDKVTDFDNLADLYINAVHYSDFESHDISGWTVDGSGSVDISHESKKGKGSLMLNMQTSGRGSEFKLERAYPVQGDKMYFIGAWMKLSDKVDNPSEFNTGIRRRILGAQFINAEGGEEGNLHRLAVTPERYSDYPGSWWFVNRIVKAPENADSVKLQLVNSFPGTVWYDNIIFSEIITGSTNAMSVERKAAKKLDALTVWQEDPIIKVFQDDLPPGKPSEFSISAARNESEPLQLVIRSPKSYEQVQINVTAPIDINGNLLDQVQVGVVGYVPINYPSNYYGARDNPNPWRVKYPSGRDSGSDGWAGMWPDPILPYHSFDLAAHVTQPIWIEFKVPKNAVAGDYTGQVQLVHNSSVLKEIPFSVRVWDFELPDKSNTTALYDVRGRISANEKKEIWKILADHRLAPDRVSPDPTWEKVNGQIVYDFTEYDKAASFYFDTLKFSYTYPPGFYLFGWGNPPAVKFGEAPYPGEYPYAGADRSKLRPEFKKVYQSAVRAYWNHMKAKGWADKVLFYISDEPHSNAEITAQMKALCDMIHEVDPKIPIYVSSWWHRPEYAGYIDIWGVSNHGSTWGRPVPLSDFTNIKNDGGRMWFTTDGKLCTDTPYLGFERLTPHYAFKFGAEGYEFWAANWYTFNPFDYGFHNHIRQSGTPGRVSWTRYPNGDGYIIYPGHHIGIDSYVGSLRLKLAREGVEDYEYLHYLNSLVALGRKQGRDVSQGEIALENAKKLVIFPTAEGRFSTEYIPDPYAIMRTREEVAEAITSLLKDHVAIIKEISMK